MLSAGGFRFLILPVQLTPFPVYPGLHVIIITLFISIALLSYVQGACTNVRAFSVVTESIGVAVMPFKGSLK